MMKDDPAIARIRESRRRISARHGHDAGKLVKYYIELQKKYQAKLVREAELDAPHH